MSTEKKVDVLAVLAYHVETYKKLNRAAKSPDDHIIDIEEAQAVAEVVAELIEATAFLSAELLRKHGGTAAVGEARVRAALARVGGAP